MKKYIYYCFFCIPIFYIWGSYLIDNKNHHLHYIWTDAEGYYIYLPCVFVYHTFKNVPCRDSGMIQHLEPTKYTFTKFTYGTALLESPFYVLGHTIRSLQGITTFGGYTQHDGMILLLAACFYLVLGAFFIYKTLCNYFNDFRIIWLSLLCGTLGTNTLYYAIRAPGYSHIYSFALISIWIYSTPIYLNLTQRNWKHTGYLAFLYGLIVLIRPTNFIILAYLLFYDCYTIEHLKLRLLFWWRLFNLKNIISAVAGGLLPFVPQLLYWQMLFGKWLSYSYKQEKFIYWSAPRFASVWFDVLNGLFPYSPIFFLAIVGMFIGCIEKKHNGWIILFLFMGLSYLFASWWCWWFGGAHGQRSFVEHTPFFAISIGTALQYLYRQSAIVQKITTSIVLILIWLNIRMIILHDTGWFGENWTWASYWNIIKIAFLF